MTTPIEEKVIPATVSEIEAETGASTKMEDAPKAEVIDVKVEESKAVTEMEAKAESAGNEKEKVAEAPVAEEQPMAEEPVPEAHDCPDDCDEEAVVVVGSDLDDKIVGGCGNDVLIGARGNDKLKGGEGNDYISGNQGKDKMWGGEGADVFVFDGDFDKDIVMDFNADEDMLQFVFYLEHERDWTAESVLDFAVQKGNHVEFRVPHTDELARLKNTDLDDLTTDHFDIVQYEAPELLMA